MSQASDQYLRNMLGGLEGVPSARLAAALQAAGRQVRRDGIQDNHESFADLQCLFAAHLLESSGDLASVISRSVGDVSVSFDRSGRVSSWVGLYRLIKLGIQGMAGRVS
jgi:hypothetical protein